MLDIKFIRENRKEVEEMLAKRRVRIDVGHILEIDDMRRKLIQEVEGLRKERREVATQKDIEKGRILKEKLIKKEAALAGVVEELEENLENLPNMLSPQVPPGDDEKDSVVVRQWGEIADFDFEAKDHLTLGKNLGIIDQERAAKVSGHGFYYLVGDGARLEIALVSWVVDFLVEKGYTPIITPELVRKRFVAATGYLPRREKPDIYKIENEDLFLVATAEIPIAAYHADETFAVDTLPKNYIGFSSAFRAEAGSYGKYTHGIFRVHEFDKLEIFKFVKPEGSEKAYAEILSLQEEIYQNLKVPYRVTLTCTGDMPAAAYLKHDLEYWDPVNKIYRELTSASNTTDYQARRLNIKYSIQAAGGRVQGTEYVHTLNGTAVALSRAIIAILENYQQKDGKVLVPQVLRKYVGKESL